MRDFDPLGQDDPLVQQERQTTGGESVVQCDDCVGPRRRNRFGEDGSRQSHGRAVGQFLDVAPVHHHEPDVADAFARRQRDARRLDAGRVGRRREGRGARHRRT